jgi:creatinine amidohydrolase
LIEALAGAVAEKLGAFLLPVQPISTCYEHHGKKGSVHYEADVFYRFLIGIAEKLHKNGFHKIAILPGHGGIFVLEPAVRHLNAAYADLTVIAVDAYDVHSYPDNPFTSAGANADASGGANANASVSTVADDIHAGDMETSLMLYLHPGLADMSKAIDFIPDKPRPYLNYGSIFTMSPSGVWGNAAQATAEKGKWLFNNATDAAVAKINEMLEKIACKNL